MNRFEVGPSDEELHRRVHSLLRSEIAAEEKETTDEATIHLELARIIDRPAVIDEPPPLVEAPSSGFWKELDQTERGLLRDAARPRTYTGGMRLCYEGDPSDHVIIIEDGWAKVTSTTEDGHEVVHAIRGPGDLVGESAVLGHRPRSATITALDSLRALVLSANRFTAFLDDHPRTWRMVSSMLVRRTNDDVRRLSAKVSADGSRRLAMLLVELADIFGADGQTGGIVIQPPLSQSELANWVDSSRETVARALKLWRARGLITTARRKITVLDTAALRAYAEGVSLPAALADPSQGDTPVWTTAQGRTGQPSARGHGRDGQDTGSATVM